MRVEIKSTFVETVQDFIKIIRNFGGGFFEWYVGMTVDPKRSFEKVHRVDISERDWILSYECPFEVALFIRRFLVSLGCVNAPAYDLEVKSDKMVYVYLFRLNEGDELYSLQ